MKKRIAYLDNVKAFLILTVVMVHSLVSTLPSYQSNILFRYIVPFNMELFMFVSGYLMYKEEQPWSKIPHRFMQLMVPYFVWELIYGIKHVIFDQGDLMDKVISHLTGAFVNPAGDGLWFLWALFFITVIQIAVVNVAKKLKMPSEILTAVVAVVMAAGLVVLKFKSFGYQFVAWHYIYFNIGFYAKKHKEAIKPFAKYLMVSSVILYAVVPLFWVRNGLPTFVSHGHIAIGYAYMFVCAVIGMCAFYTLFRTFANKESRFMGYIGKCTLAIYMVHFLVLEFFTFVLIPALPFDMPLWSQVAFKFILTPIVCFGAHEILTKNKTVAHYLFGTPK